METKQNILDKIADEKCWVIALDLEQDVILPAMEKYAIQKMITENESILEMAKIHMDSRSIMVLNDRISKLKLELTCFD